MSTYVSLTTRRDSVREASFNIMASCKHVWSRFDCVLRSAPCSTNSSMAADCPLRVARWRAVKPLLSRWLRKVSFEVITVLSKLWGFGWKEIDYSLIESHNCCRKKCVIIVRWFSYKLTLRKFSSNLPYVPEHCLLSTWNGLSVLFPYQYFGLA